LCIFLNLKKEEKIPDLVSREISAKMFSLFIPSARHKREKDEENRLAKKQMNKCNESFLHHKNAVKYLLPK
jgi:hypothetical protein